MNGDIVAQRYAKALFALGQQEGMAKLEQYGENLSALDPEYSNKSSILPCNTM